MRTRFGRAGSSASHSRRFKLWRIFGRSFSAVQLTQNRVVSRSLTLTIDDIVDVEPCYCDEQSVSLLLMRSRMMSLHIQFCFRMESNLLWTTLYQNSQS